MSVFAVPPSSSSCLTLGFKLTEAAATRERTITREEKTVTRLERLCEDKIISKCTMVQLLSKKKMTFRCLVYNCWEYPVKANRYGSEKDVNEIRDNMFQFIYHRLVPPKM